MAEKQALQVKAAPKPSVMLTPVRSPLVQRRCACGGIPGPDGECEACRRKRLGLQRSALDSSPVTVPSVVREVLRSSGQSLDSGARQQMEAHFGQDFSRVRVHTDARAADSAQAVHARAYTVGQNIVFGRGNYQPGSSHGQRLLAHELAHTIQQQGIQRSADDVRLDTSPEDDQLEREATAAADAVMSKTPATVTQRPAKSLISRQGDDEPEPAPMERTGQTAYQANYRLDIPGMGTRNFHVFARARPPGSGSTPQLVAFDVDRFYLSGRKGDQTVIDLWQQRAGAGALETVVRFGENSRGQETQRAGLYQSRGGTSYELRPQWLSKVNWSGLATDTVTRMWRRAGGSGGFPDIGGVNCDVDHIVELQVGGTNVPENLQMLDHNENEAIGFSIWRDQIRPLAERIRNRQDPQPSEILLHFRQVEAVGAIRRRWSSQTCTDRINDGRATSCWDVECCAPYIRPQPEAADYILQAGGLRASIVVDREPTDSTPVDILFAPATGGNIQNVSAAELIPGLILIMLRRQRRGRGTSATIQDRVQAIVDQREFERRAGELRPRRETRTPSTIPTDRRRTFWFLATQEGTTAVRNLQLDTRDSRVQFTYPYLSEVTMQMNYDPQTGLSGTGTLTPSLPFLNRARVNVRYERQQLSVLAPIPANRIAPPGIRVTRGELGLELSPQFRPYGVLTFEAGPRNRPIFDGELNASADENGLVLDGNINAHLPRVDTARGNISYRNGQWSGFIDIQSTQIGIPGIQRGQLRVDYTNEGPQLSGGITLEVAGQNIDLTVRRRGQTWIYTGRGTFHIPRLRPVNLEIETDGNNVTGSAQTGIDFSGFSGDVRVNYRNGRFSGEGAVRFNRGRANGTATIRVSPARRISGQGQLTYQLTENLIGTVGIDMPEQGPVRVTGALEFSRPIQLFPRFPRSVAPISIFEFDQRIPIPGASIGPIGLEARIHAGLSLTYYIGPGQITNIRVITAFNPLEENPNLELQASARLLIPAGAGLSVSLGGGVEISAYIASVGGDITITGTAELNGGLQSDITITYRQSRFTVDTPVSLLVRPSVLIRLTATVYAEAGVWRFKVRTDKTWELASYRWGANFETGFRTRLGYDSETGLRIPSLSEIEFVRPSFEVGSTLGGLFSSARTQERED